MIIFIIILIVTNLQNIQNQTKKWIKKGAYKEAPSISQSKQSVELNSDRH